MPARVCHVSLLKARAPCTSCLHPPAHAHPGHPPSPPLCFLAGTHESLLSNGAGPDALSFVHVLRRCNGEACTELVRARTAWRAGEPPVDAASE